MLAVRIVVGALTTRTCFLNWLLGRINKNSKYIR